MATNTTHYYLTKPDTTDRADISVLNTDLDTIDSQMYSNAQLASEANTIAHYLAPEYDSSQTYTTGAMVLHENKLYRTSYSSVTGDWDSSKWSLVTLATQEQADIASIGTSLTNMGNSISTLFSNYGNLMSMAWALTNSIAPQYSSSTSYTVGDVVMKNQSLYKCIADTTGDWDSSKWTSTNLIAIIRGE